MTFNLKTYFFLFFMGFIFCCSLTSRAQQSLKIKVIDAASSESLPGSSVTLENTPNGGTANADGLVELLNLPAGVNNLKVSFIGYKDTLVSITIPHEAVFIVKLEAAEEELEEIIVSSTRTNKRIEDLPLKVEVLGLEEMDEESALVPGNIASILGDLAVITIQRTNPINGNDAIRMQGLDPQYTLLAKDGLPLYGGFSGSLGVLSIPPLDLKQVEIIKGSVSTLYGGGAITGMINFISKEPSAKPQRTLLFNASTLKEKNINTFFSGKLGQKAGYTLFAGANVKSPVDVNKDGFSEIPEHQNYIFHPRFFFTFNEKTKLNVGLTSTVDNRKTGDMAAVKDEPTPQHPYLRKENSFRNVVDIQYTHDFTKTHAFTFKTALSTFQRGLAYPYRNYPSFRLNAIQYSSYSEASDRVVLGKNTLVTGINLITESFRKISGDAVPLNNYDYITTGIFAQNDWQVTEKFMVEAGVRFDYHNINGAFFLPRVALFYKASNALSVRLASGAGYKAPNILSLTDPTPYTFNNGASVTAEHSRGVNADINYNTIWWDELEVSLNQAFYFADVKNPLRVVTDTLAQRAYLENQNYKVTTLGTDTYVQMVYKNFELYLGYNHTEALQKYSPTHVFMPFNPKDKFSTTFAYAIEGKWRAGIEGSYSANQYAYGSQYYFNSKAQYVTYRVPNFWFLAAMIERKLGFGSIILNVENLTDSRQAKFENLYSGSITSPTFKPIWGPLDGRVFNLSVKVNL
jgi:outer membrane receptor for ferrienterochelin and colicins